MKELLNSNNLKSETEENSIYNPHLQILRALEKNVPNGDIKM